MLAIARRPTDLCGVWARTCKRWTFPTDNIFSNDQEIRPTFKRLSISQAILDSHIGGMQIPKLFPNLKHLEIERNKPKNRVGESYVKEVLCQLQSLESIELSIERTNISDVIPKLPALKALKLNPETSYSCFKTFIELCPNLQVLALSTCCFVLTTDHLCTAIKWLPNLQILKIKPWIHLMISCFFCYKLVTLDWTVLSE